MTIDELKALGDKLIVGIPNDAKTPEEQQFRDLAVVAIALGMELLLDIKRIANAAEQSAALAETHPSRF